MQAWFIMITSLLALISLDRTINSCQRNPDPRYGSIHECSYSYTCAHCLRELGLHHRDTWLEQILILTCLTFKVRIRFHYYSCHHDDHPTYFTLFNNILYILTWRKYQMDTKRDISHILHPSMTAILYRTRTEILVLFHLWFIAKNNNQASWSYCCSPSIILIYSVD